MLNFFLIAHLVLEVTWSQNMKEVKYFLIYQQILIYIDKEATPGQIDYYFQVSPWKFPKYCYTKLHIHAELFINV